MPNTSRAGPNRKFAAALGLAAACLAPAFGLSSAQAAVVLWNQPLSTTNNSQGNPFAGGAHLSTQFTDFPTSSTYGADNFSNPVPWQISRIFVPGDLWSFTPGTSLANASTLTFAIYADVGGVPAGFPGGPAPYASASFAPSNAQILLTNGTSGYLSNVQVDLLAPLLLPAGNWWLSFYPTMSYSGVGNYGRQVSDTTNGPVGHAINPGGAFGSGTAWTPINLILEAPAMDLAFRIEGDVVGQVPEPSTALLVAGGLVALTLRARRSPATGRQA